MITDEMKNIRKYKEITAEICDFIENLSENIECGKHYINDDDYANVEVYEPKEFENCAFESHEKYIDVQLLLSGKERIDFRGVEGLHVDKPYDEQRDITFYENNLSDDFNTVILNSRNFAVFYPTEAHKPQIKLENGKVKKVVVKIKING